MSDSVPTAESMPFTKVCVDCLFMYNVTYMLKNTAQNLHR